MKFLLAISGGVDSMVLLWIFEQLDCDFGVVHINHQLRQASQVEEHFLMNYCTKKEIPFVCRRWNFPCENEEAARTFRYQVFQEIMEENGYDILCTAHHKNDVAETITRRFIQGTHPFHLTVLEEVQPFSTGFLWRPFLSVTKKELRTFAVQQQITYFEDESNTSTQFQRNRLRHQILPMFEKENPSVIDSLSRLNKQLRKEREMLSELLLEKLEKSFCPNTQCFDLNQWAAQYHTGFIWVIAEQMTKTKGIVWSKGAIQQLQSLVNTTAGTQSFEYKGYLFLREYHQLLIKKCNDKSANDAQTASVIHLLKNQWYQLDQSHCVYFGTEKPAVPQSYIETSCFKIPSQQVWLRHPKPEDKLAIDSLHHQKLSRLFINNKIPRPLRDKQWVVVDEKNILGVLGIRQSYLRNLVENGKINYIIYYTLRE